MHLVNDNGETKKSKLEYFKYQVNNIGKPVALTSITTAIGFLSFCFSNVLPISRLGMITTIGISISLFVILVTYSICIELNLHLIKGKNLQTNNDNVKDKEACKKAYIKYLLYHYNLGCTIHKNYKGYQKLVEFIKPIITDYI